MTAVIAKAHPIDPPLHAAHAMSDAPVPLPITNATSFADLMANIDAVMHSGMTNASRTGQADHDFASAMVPHHQGAVDMAKVELLFGKDPVLRRIAQEIIITQQQEIAVMQRRLDVLQGHQESPTRKTP